MYIYLTENSGFHKLIIEAKLYPVWAYSVISEDKDYKVESMLIKSFDMEAKDFRLLMNILKDLNIDFEEKSNGLLVNNKFVSAVFLQTDFGKSLDRFILNFYDYKNQHYWIDVSYESIPDLIISSNSYEILEDLKSKAERNGKY